MEKEEVSKDVGEMPEKAKEAPSAASPAQEFYEEATSKLKEMGYYIFKDEDDGMTKFRQTDENKKFKFINQKHYDLLGDIL